MSYKFILFKKTDRVGFLTLYRPEVRNAINSEAIEEIMKAINEVKNDNDLDVLIITGTGKSFCAGADTTEFLEMTMEENQIYLNRFWEMTKSIQELTIPVIGAVNGFAFGGGAEIATVCDFRIGSEQASFRFPGSSYGLVVTSSQLPNIVGIPKAKELLLRSCIINAEEAVRIGLLNHIVKEEEIIDFTIKIAKEIRGNSMDAVKKIKETIDLGLGKEMGERLKLENKANQYLTKHTNYRQTFSDFVEKRKNKQASKKS